MNRLFFARIDWSIITPVLIIVLLSLITLFSINKAFFENQLFFFAVSLVVFIFCTQLDLRSLRTYVLPLYILALVCFTVVLIVGLESRGAVRWLDIFGARIQFSEFFKPLLAYALAVYLGTRQKLSFGTFLTAGILLLPIALLIAKQPDLGNALIYVMIGGLTMLFVGFPLLWFGIILVLLGAATPILWHFLHDYQKHRILTFIQPGSDPLGTSYNAIQSIIAVGSGGFLGKGLGAGTQSGLRFLPERHTDFIFASFAESAGFLGVMVLLACFIYLSYRLIMIYSRTQDPVEKIFVAMGFFLIILQAFINIGMNIGMLPIVGVTLPFMSYGGSSLLANFILLGMLCAIAKQPQNTHTLAIR